MTSQEQIDEFLARKRFAFVGLSRDPKHFSRVVFRNFRAQGYDPVPVHPEAAEIEGEPCYPSISAIQPRLDAALLMTLPDVTCRLADACAAAGIEQVWIYRSSPEALESFARHGIRVISGECPLMFLPNATWIHRFHGFVKKITGTWPQQSAL